MCIQFIDLETALAIALALAIIFNMCIQFIVLDRYCTCYSLLTHITNHGYHAVCAGLTLLLPPKLYLFVG